MNLAQRIARRDIVLTEGSVFEILRRDPRVQFDEHIAHAGLIYDDHTRELLAGIHRRYRDIAHATALPFLALTDTWRASGERIARSRFHDRDVNRDNIAFLRDIAGKNDFLGGLTGPRGDAYRPAEAPSFEEALRVHEFQIETLAAAHVDVLMAATLPTFAEARAIARLMSNTGVPWMLSFVVRPEGTLLDGTPFAAAIAQIDDATNPPPLGYSINCVHPVIAENALRAMPAEARRRVIAFQGNTSTLSPEELDNAPELQTTDPRTFAEAITSLRSSSEICVVGGCCGTDERHMRAIAQR